MTQRLTIEIPIRAMPGSNTKRGFINPKTGRVIIADKAKGKAGYTAAVRMFAEQAARDAGWEPTRAPIMLVVDFIFTRPLGHFGTGKNAQVVKPSAPKHVTVKPDLTNLIKTTEDALRGITWIDDSQVVGMQLAKVYGEKDLVRIQVAALEN
jgi:Holliday junction resolvase RusA-like endonuclease